MHQKAFENVKDQIGYCGLWCGSCIVGNGTLRELTKRYEHLVRGYGIDDWGAKGFDAEEFRKGLKAMQDIPVCPGCLRGGGNDKCKVRPCALKKAVSDCAECGSAKCMHSEELNRVRTGAHAVGMLIKKEKGNRKELKRRWATEVRAKFPYIVIEVPHAKDD